MIILKTKITFVQTTFMLLLLYISAITDRHKLTLESLWTFRDAKAKFDAQC